MVSPFGITGGQREFVVWRFGRSVAWRFGGRVRSYGGGRGGMCEATNGEDFDHGLATAVAPGRWCASRRTLHALAARELGGTKARFFV